MADENNSNEDGQFVPDGSMEPLSPQEADNTDYGLMVGERIQKKDLQQEMRDSYLAYAMSVIVDRALPDVRDGMKPVHRRVIYAMYDGGYRPDRGYSKCARVVGEVMGKYHPHGDSAIYDTLVRMAQSWSMRYTLVDGQGNFGSPGDDPAAAMRYTECRMAPLAMEMVRDIDKDTVDFLPNYDGKTQEPTVLPARFPNLLCNGSSGIAVGMATNIPPHNMREVAEGVHWALDHPDASREELLENLIRIIKGPDFPTGATILGHKGIEQAYRTGRGLITMRAVVNTEEIKGRMCLVITELPYQVNPDRLVVSIREAVRDGKIQASPTCVTKPPAVPDSVSCSCSSATPCRRLCSITCTSIPSCSRPSVPTCWHWSMECHVRCLWTRSSAIGWATSWKSSHAVLPTSSVRRKSATTFCRAI